MKKYFLLYLFTSMQSFAQTNELNDFVWDTKNISVCWEKSTKPFNTEKKWVQQAIKETWENESGITFNCWCNCDNSSKGIRISIDDVRPNTSSVLGNRLDGKINGMTLNFTYKSTSIPIGVRNNYNLELDFINNKPNNEQQRQKFIKATAVHEFGHALGLSHQNNRSDCKFADCFLDDDQQIQGALWFTPCDEYSVMNYCSNAYLNDGNLSQLDIITINTLYPKTAPRSVNRSLAINYTSNPDSDQIKKEVQKDAGPTQRNPDKYEVLANNLIIYLTGDPNLLKNIDSVNFRPHGSTLPITTILGDRNLYYAKYRKIWGSFTVRVDVRYKNGSLSTLTRYIDAKNTKVVYTTFGDKIRRLFDSSNNKNSQPPQNN